MTKSIPQWIDRRVQLGAVALFGCLLASCTDGADPSTPVANGRARIPLVAYYAGAHAPSTAPINRIRITVTTDPGGREFGPFVVEVDPAAAEWTVPVEIPLATPTDVIVVAELINFANNTETVEFSGRMGPFRVTPGPAASTPPTSLQVFPGPLANLNVTAVRVSGAAPVIEGGSIQLIATLEGAGPGAQVFWTSLDPTLATVSATGLVQTLLPGTARIVATAGPRSDEARIDISRRMARIELLPASRTASSLGETVDFTARVLDPRNAEFAGVPLTWSAADPNIAEHLGNGRFRAKTRGRTAITATVDGSPTLRASGEFIVDQRVARIELAPASRTIDAPGLTASFSAVARDAGGNVMEGVAFRWTAVNTAIATIDQAGVATARAIGTTEIRAEANGITGSAQLEVRQRVARIEVTPAEYTFTAINERTRFTAVVRDANNSVMDRAVTWRSVNASVVSIDDRTGEAASTSRGGTTLLAEVDGVAGSARVTVTPVVSRITFNTSAITLTGPGQSFQLEATVRDANNFPVPGKTVTWSSQTPNVATVSPSGLVTGVAAGSGRIAATVDGFVVTVPVTVGTVTGGTGPGGDLIVFNDINIFGFSGTSGHTLAGNFASFSGTGPRASGNTVWLQCGRTPIFNVNWCNYDGIPRTALIARGFTVVDKNDPVGSIVSVPADVKMIFFFMPTGLFTSTELGVLRTFVEQGGRIVYLGEHSSGFEATYPPENQLLQMMGTTTRMSPDDNDIGCLSGAGTLASHPVLNNVTSISFACVAAFRSIDPDDFTLVSYGTHPAIVLVKLQTPTAPDLQLSARTVAMRINAANQRAAEAWFKQLKSDGQDPTQGPGRKRIPNARN